jgi:tetratricopeptide (TPR) repeat protein
MNRSGRATRAAVERIRPSLRGLAAGLALAAALAFTALPCHAVEWDDDPQAAAADPDYAAGRKAMEAKDWNGAIKFFSTAARRSPDNADLQNYLGYAHRKAGKLDPAFKHYKRALELNPRHRGAHEYIGEAYLMVNNLAKADEHLAALDRICLLPCEEFTDLKGAISAYKKRAGAK